MPSHKKTETVAKDHKENGIQKKKRKKKVDRKSFKASSDIKKILKVNYEDWQLSSGYKDVCNGIGLDLLDNIIDTSISVMKSGKKMIMPKHALAGVKLVLPSTFGAEEKIRDSIKNYRDSIEVDEKRKSLNKTTAE